MPPKKNLSPAMERVNNWVAEHLSSIKYIEKIFFVDHMRTMIQAGLSLVEALNILEKETENRKFKNIIIEIRSEIEQGKNLSEVLEKHPKAFPPIYVKMVASGEVAGQLEQSLEQIVIQMRKQHDLISSIRGAMVYPAVIILALVSVAILMVTVVLPKLLEIFKDFDAELPLATKLLIAITDFMSDPFNLTLIFGGLVLFIILFVTGLKKSPRFRSGIHNMNLHLPIFGKVIKKINLARFSMTLSSLLHSTVPIISAIDITGDTCSNLKFREALHSAKPKLETGAQLSEVLQEHPKLFPPMVSEMILVGERTGEIGHMLEQISDFFAKEVDRTMKNFTTIIEPIIILVLGVAVAGMALAVMMPMYSLVQNF
ncbi:type II secretion system F family protein [Candidatus Nomurabacteria bacterium]|nr:type II secretion system F family protein [Candidatus Nomurabacteria bacterium]